MPPAAAAAIPSASTDVSLQAAAAKAAVGSADAVRPDAVKPAAAADGYEFEWSFTEEPHASRRKAILAKYGPTVRALYGPDPTLKWRVALCISLQLGLAYLCKDIPWFGVLILAYALGGTINHSLSLAMHETSHNLAFKGFFHNRWFGLVANLPLAIPVFASFKRYHMEHHRYQGEDGIDVDVPTKMETVVFRSSVAKLLWVVIQPLFYALRPLAVLPKKPTSAEAMNWTLQIAFDLAVLYFFGLKGLGYLLASTLLGLGAHPMAGHFIAEHYTFVRGVETYSYYGPLNWFSYNVGYHNEHHDFPFVSGARLPQLRLIAPEFYDTLPFHSSWVSVLVHYITMPHIGPYSRIKRDTLSKADRDWVLSGGEESLSGQA